MDRRDFLAGLLGGATLLGGGGLTRVAHAMSGIAHEGAPLPAVLTRRNVYCMSVTSPEIVAYRKAITVMKARPATDPTSWLAQANIHGSFSPPPGMIADACEHGNLFFLSWHRIYLYYFERIVRAASGSPTFALPYWGYSPTGQRDLPALFRTPATIPELYVSQRRATINSGSSLAASVVDAGAAMAQIAFGGFGGFSPSLEGTPHGVVHTGVGGPGGWMSAFETAGQDPIFWLHHANLDRLWGVWLASGGGRANPTDAAWLTHSWEFYDETGARVHMTGAQVLNTATQLNYQYAGPLCLRRPPLPYGTYTKFPWLDPRLLRMLEQIKVRPPLPGPPPPPIAQQGSIRLGAAATDVRLPVAAEGQQVLKRFPTKAGTERQISLVFEDVRLTAPPSVYYEVYIDLPDSSTNVQYTNPHYAGNIDLFGPSLQGKHRDMTRTRSISLLPVFAQLSASGQWRNDTLRVTLIPRAYTEGESPTRLLGATPQATIGRMSVHIE